MQSSEENYPRISIITVVYNDVTNILETIKSVRNQTYKNIEYIIIDGDSDDGTKELIQSNLEFIDFLKSEPDNGIYDAINKGIRVATGDYVGFLHCGDLFSDKYVITKVADEILRERTDAVFADVDIVDAKDTNIVIRHYSGKNFSKWKLRIGAAPPHPSLYCRREIYTRIGLYKTNYRVSSDYEMIVRMFIVNKISYSYMNFSMVKMRVGGESNNGIIGQFQQNLEIIDAAKSNKLYTNIFLVFMKLPLRLLQYIFRS